ncbi:MAG: hypothetical protein HC787_03315, partial [Nostocaceae cyanobacterium CSU_2_110]|nr:hypothetical protein [Nostocaceae cyanobacterium CSU_2_110]
MGAVAVNTANSFTGRQHMADKMKDSTNFHNSLSQIEWDLLTTLLEPEDNTYPWNSYEDDTQ